MKIEFKDGRAYITVSYNKDFIDAIKQIGGSKWEPSTKQWNVPEESVDIIRKIMLDVYGESDIAFDQKLTLKITFTERKRALTSPINMFGKQIAGGYGKYSTPTVGDDAAFLEGRAFVSGSSKNWNTTIDADSIVILKNVTRKNYEKYKNKYGEFAEIEIIEKQDRKSQLLEEQKRLQERLAEIEEELKNEM